MKLKYFLILTTSLKLEMLYKCYINAPLFRNVHCISSDCTSEWNSLGSDTPSHAIPYLSVLLPERPFKSLWSSFLYWEPLTDIPHTHTDGTSFIPSIADAGGNEAQFGFNILNTHKMRRKDKLLFYGTVSLYLD